MKTSGFDITLPAFILAAAIFTNFSHAQTAASPVPASSLASQATPYAIVELGANYQVWERETYDPAPDGSIVTNIHKYTELATGLNHLVNGQWVASKEEIDISPNGNWAAATNGQHQVYFPGDIYNGVIELDTPDGLKLQSQPIGLSYDDGTNTVLIAELTNSTGEILSSGNQAIYPNAFTGIAADLLYIYTKAGFEQDIILREQPPDPASFGLNPQTTRLQVLTEFFNPPQPVVSTNSVPTPAGNLTDENLSFGAMAMMPAKAFLLGTNSPSVEVSKQWLMLDGRQFLVEEVPVVSLADELENLPLAQTISTRPNPPLNVVLAKRLLPTQRLATVPGKHPMQLAKNIPFSQGLVLDYVTLNSNQTNYTFQCDTTYYISGPVNLNWTTTVEGGTVIKYTNSSSAIVNIVGIGEHPGALNMQTSPYHPAIFTSQDDNTVGDVISVSSGNPVQGAATYLEIHADGYYGTPIRNARFLFAGTAISQVQYYNVLCQVWDCQFVQCGAVFSSSPTYSPVGNLEWHNVLISQCGVGFTNTSGGIGQSVIGEQVTADQVGYLVYAAGWNGSSAYLTNSILTAVGPVYPPNGGITNLVNCQSLPSSAGVFQSVGAANYYLADGTYRQQGTPNISTAMLAELADKTTYPPTVLTSDFNTATVLTRYTSLTPARRDNSGTPDLGYHYDPLDYCWSGLRIYSSLTLSNGVAVGFYGSTGLNGGNLLVSQGTALNLNHLVLYSAVQEQPVIWGTRQAANYLLNGNPATLQMRLTDLSLAGGGSSEYLSSGTAYNINLWDSQLLAVKLQPSYAPYPTITLGLTNNIFQRCALSFASCGSINSTYYVNFYNNLFLYGSLEFSLCEPSYAFYQNVSIADNLFVDCAFSYYSYLGYGPRDISYNGYYQTTRRWGSAPSGYGPAVSGGDVLLTNLDFQTGTLGNYYYPATGTNLARLIDAGSMTAASAGLASYTTQTNQTPDTGMVDIGFHYRDFAIRPGFNQNILIPNDDDCYGGGDGDNGNYLTNLLANIGFSINFFGTTYTNLYVNNNGNVTFDELLSAYTPEPLADLVNNNFANNFAPTNIIAPFWADVDTRGINSGVVTYGTNSVNGNAAFGANWIDVGYYKEEVDKLNEFQLVLINRSDRTNGDFDLEFDYSQIQWETGDGSGGSDGLGGSSARAGYASAGGSTFELNGSGINGAFLDTNKVTGLIYTNFNSTVPGRYVFQFHNGVPLGTP